MNKIRDEEPIDRRSDFRIRAEIPAVVHFGSGDVLNEEARMIATTLGVKGVSITGPSQFLLGQELNVDLQITETTKPLRFKGKVLSKTDSHGTSEPKYGVSFEFMAPNAREIYYSWMANSLLDREKIQDRRASVNVITELISFQNRSGRKVVGFLDRLIDHQNSKKVIVIPWYTLRSKTEFFDTVTHEIGHIKAYQKKFALAERNILKKLILL